MIEQLNHTQYEIAQLSALGCTQKEIAYALGINVCKVNNTMRIVHQTLNTDEHTLPRVFIGEKYNIPDIAEPLSQYDFFRPSVKLRPNTVIAILLVLSLEAFNASVLRVRRAGRARRVKTEYVFGFNIEA